MKNLFRIFMIASFGVFFVLSSQSCKNEVSDTSTSAKKECCEKKPCCTADATICGKCGEIKGSEKCCSANAEICSKCGLHKGSPGCCKIEKGKDVKCSEVKDCCKKDTAKCCNSDAKKESSDCCEKK